VNGFGGWRNALASGWTLNSIVALRDAFPFTPQLSFNPSNNGDTRNPVRPSLNPTFSGKVVLGSPKRKVAFWKKSSHAAKTFGVSNTTRPLAATKSRFFASLRMTCHPDPALREKDLLFFAPRDEVGA